ncbi:hypothetical protein ACFFJB_10285 [Camelimonas abortus]|uniref:Uncharacterized protein n=1 Tax=Camelimonas abortus TaxID=1017184 RepID=A0ABV7LC39_9HYPH
MDPVKVTIGTVENGVIYYLQNGAGQLNFVAAEETTPQRMTWFLDKVPSFDDLENSPPMVVRSALDNRYLDLAGSFMSAGGGLYIPGILSVQPRGLRFAAAGQVVNGAAIAGGIITDDVNPTMTVGVRALALPPDNQRQLAWRGFDNGMPDDALRAFIVSALP